MVAKSSDGSSGKPIVFGKISYLDNSSIRLTREVIERAQHRKSGDERDASRG